jgi:hypothetical protein
MAAGVPPMSATRLVILGTEHSPQLVAESYQPAVFRAFFARVQPQVLCIEQPPGAFVRGDYRYGEYAYERHHIALPWARQRGLPVYPVDWVLPEGDDQRLVWGVPDIEAPPFLRTWGAVRGFMRFPKEMLDLELFFAESEAASRRVAAWYDRPRQPGERDFSRRLGLYRTFLQAMRVKAVARQHPGETVLVVIGYFHKGDIEGVLAGTPDVEIVQPSSFGHPPAGEIDAEVLPTDLLAILSFNLLGVQAKDGPVNWDWMERSLRRLEADAATAETLLLRTRLAVLQSEVDASEAIRRYEQVRAMQESATSFTFDGVADRGRLDSYYDPFGNLTIANRALVEIAREQRKLGQVDAARQILAELSADGGLRELPRHQLAAYWDEFVLRTP